jgi:hypothetical protein
LAPIGSTGASATWNGPSTVLSEAPDGLRLLIASTSIETPRTSDSRMNSCRHSLQICPVRVRNWIASNHSASVGSISLTASCSLRMTTSITAFNRALPAVLLRPVTTSAEVASVKNPCS